MSDASHVQGHAKEPRREILAEGVEIWLGDCRSVFASLGAVAAVITDPPFGISYESGYATDELWVGGRSIANDNSVEARDQALAVCTERWGPPMLVFGSHRAPEPAGTRMWLVWDKGPALGMGALDLPWKPSFEIIFAIGKGFVGSRDGGVIYCPPVQSMAKNGRQHPNQKPINLLEKLIAKCPAGTILDPFMGSGSCGVAAVRSGRPFVGIEVEPSYFEIARERISDELRRPRMFTAPAATTIQEGLPL